MAQLSPCREDVSAEMGAHVACIEACLSALDKAFATSDGDLITAQSQQLQRTLAESLVAFRKAEQAGLHPLDEAMRSRLKLAQSRLLAQQAAVHRANATIDRTLKVLFPAEESSTYGNPGASPVAKALGAYR